MGGEVSRLAERLVTLGASVKDKIRSCVDAQDITCKVSRHCESEGES